MSWRRCSIGPCAETMRSPALSIPRACSGSGLPHWVASARRDANAGGLVRSSSARPPRRLRWPGRSGRDRDHHVSLWLSPPFVAVGLTVAARALPLRWRTAATARAVRSCAWRPGASPSTTRRAGFGGRHRLQPVLGSLAVDTAALVVEDLEVDAARDRRLWRARAVATAARCGVRRGTGRARPDRAGRAYRAPASRALRLPFSAADRGPRRRGLCGVEE